MDKKWLRARHFESLSIRDLLDAREAYHVHLAHLDNVFATAVGRYLVRETDPDADDPHQQHRHGEDPPPEPRTLANSAPRRWSWPCIVVFVERWQDRGDFAEAPDSMVPRYLYLPDGRVVPTCVVMATRDEAERPSSQTLTFPSDLIGGGYPVLTEVQGRQHIGSLGCLVTDGESIFALTNRHVAGDLDRVAETVVKGRRQKIGKSAGRSPIDPDFLVLQMVEAMPDHAILVDEGLTSSRQITALRPHRDRYGYHGLASGGIGWGLPASVGASIANPDRPVVCFSGDGSAMYSIQSLWTAAHHKLPLNVVIANNGGYRIIKQRLLAFHGDDNYVGMDFVDPPVDFAGIAKALGCEAIKVSDPRELKATLSSAFNRPGTKLIEVMVDGKV